MKYIHSESCEHHHLQEEGEVRGGEKSINSYVDVGNLLSFLDLVAWLICSVVHVPLCYNHEQERQ